MSEDARSKGGGERPGGFRAGLGSLVAVATDWKVVVTAIAAGTSLWFSFEEHRQKRLEINQKAIAYLREEDTLKRFWQDPANTINEIQSSYPRHAFCAALGVFLAEAARAEAALDAGEPGEVPPDAVTASRAALLEETSRIAEEVDYPLCRLRRIASATAEEVVVLNDAAREMEMRQSRLAGEPDADCPGDLSPAKGCASIRAVTGSLWRHSLPDECLLALDAYGENQCLVRVAERRRLNSRAQLARQESESTEVIREQLTLQYQGIDLPDPVVKVPDRRRNVPRIVMGSDDSGSGGGAEPATPPPVIEPRDEPVMQTIDDGPELQGPDAGCEGASPLVYVHFQSATNGETLRAAIEELRRIGWDLTRPDLQEKIRVRGDVRYYHAPQETCAKALANDIALALGKAPDWLRTVSLEGTYKDLPAGRMELWLPEF